MVPTLDIAIFASGVVALQNRLNAFGYTLLVANAEYDLEKEAKEVRALIERGVDGLVLVGNLHAPSVHKLLAQNRVPYVNTYSFDPGDSSPCIGFDNHGAAYRMVEYLLDLGHRHFGVITSPVRNNDRIAARRDGALAALAEHGVGAGRTAVLEVPYTIADGRTALRSLVETGRALTAVVCTADVLAIGALQECRVLGIRVPEAVSVSGFDDLDLAVHLEPPLTTVRAPASELGQKAADYLLTRIRGGTVPERVELNASLIVRGSTGPPAR